MKARNPNTGNFEKLYVKALDSMPVGTEVDFNGQASDIPVGWEEVDSNANILWTNSNPTNSFGSQNITIVNKDYDMVEVVYALLNQNNYAYRKSTGRIPYEQGKKIQAEIIDYDGNIGLVVYRRLITMTSKTEFAITDSDKLWITGGETDNTRCIPLLVIGYNTGMF